MAGYKIKAMQYAFSIDILPNSTQYTNTVPPPDCLHDYMFTKTYCQVLTKPSNTNTERNATFCSPYCNGTTFGSNTNRYLNSFVSTATFPRLRLHT